MDKNIVEQLIKKSWSKETCKPEFAAIWNEANSSVSQSDVTALVVNDLEGGNIYGCLESDGSHYYNVVNSEIIDLTVSEATAPKYDKGILISRKYLLSNENIRNRYLTLVNNIKENINLLQENTANVFDNAKSKSLKLEKEN